MMYICKNSLCTNIDINGNLLLERIYYCVSRGTGGDH